jgi:plasmid stability protein
MASLLIKNLPPRLHSQLKKRAAAHRRSLNSETIRLLEEAVSGTSSAPEPIVNHSHEGNWDEILARLPPESAQRLRALRSLQKSIESRGVDTEAWMKTASDSRR